MSDIEFRSEIVRIGRLLHEKGFVAAIDGNISVRLNDFTVLATPTCMSKGMLNEEDLVTVDMRGKKLSGFREVSSEIAMHLMIYRVRPDVSAVVHAHPPTATGFAAAGCALDEALVSEIVISLGTVPLAAYATPGTIDLCDNIEPHIEEHDAVLMANHGVVTCGDSLLAAYMNMETVEHFARISLVAHQLGKKCTLNEDQIQDLLQIRSKMREFRMLQKNRA
jgi:L-fuculose-phosphate aldolase